MFRSSLFVMAIIAATGIGLLQNAGYAQPVEYEIRILINDVIPIPCEGLDIRIQEVGDINWTDWQETDQFGSTTFILEQAFDDVWQVEWQITASTNPLPDGNSGMEGPYDVDVFEPVIFLDPEP